MRVWGGPRLHIPVAPRVPAPGQRAGWKVSSTAVYGEQDRVPAAGPAAQSEVRRDQAQPSPRAQEAAPCALSRPHSLVVQFGPSLGEGEPVQCLRPMVRTWKLGLERWASGLGLWAPGLMAFPGQGLGDRGVGPEGGSAAPRGACEGHERILVSEAGREGGRGGSLHHTARRGAQGGCSSGLTIPQAGIRRR